MKLFIDLDSFPGDRFYSGQCIIRQWRKRHPSKKNVQHETLASGVQPFFLVAILNGLFIQICAVVKSEWQPLQMLL